ncbi:MAG TPA: hypothetical protein VNR59_11550 [Gaiellaceae bacterium]|jgi:cysteine synthase A|nr:hypothetical protein [Gaiellaceae bacterium]HWJ45962.1 hypothetical protein [Gaiellaceae bacterium]
MAAMSILDAIGNTPLVRLRHCVPFVIQGWAGFVMPLWDESRVDHVEAIEDDAAPGMTLRLAQEEGIFAGISTGANVVGAHRLAGRLGPSAVIVTLAVDSGFKYMSVPPYAF